jgi:hypothetical protein
VIVRGILPVLLGLAALLLPAAPLRAQAAHPDIEAKVPDVPSGPATIHGRVVHLERPAAAAGVEVVLYALPASGIPGVRRGTTDAHGEFRFEGISNDPSVAYLVGARFGDVPFPGARVSFAKGETDHAVEVRIADATSDPGGIEVTASSLRLERSGVKVGVDESHRLRSASQRVYYVPPARRASTPPGFLATLPEGAGDLAFPLGVKPEGVVVKGREIAFYGPIYPGDQELSFHYTVSEEAARTIRKPFPSGTRDARVLLPASGMQLEGKALRPAGKSQVEGHDFRSFDAGRLAPGATLAFAVALPPARTDASALSFDESRLFLELDGASLLVREEHHLRVAGDTPVVAPHGSELLQLPLPEDASDLRFASEDTALGLAASDDGLVLQGPLPPGESTLELMYRVPLRDGSVTLDRRFEKPLPLLSVFIADSGLRVQSERLHRRRPVRTEDRTYLYLEGFDIEPSETVSLHLSPLPPRSAPGRLGDALFLALTAAAAVGFLTGPLRRRAGGEMAEEEPEPASRRERVSLYAALRDLEQDFETGKVSEEDYRTLRDDLRARAAALLQQEREAQPRAAASLRLVEAPHCPACGATPRSGDRFCAACGARLAEPTGREASA